MRDRSVDSEYYLVPPYSNEHVDEISSEDGVVTAAVFFFDFPLRGHDVLGRYGIFAVTSELSEILVKKGYSGFHLGEAQAAVSEHYPGMDEADLPEIDLLVITGKQMVDDIARTKGGLVVSKEVHDLLAGRDQFVEKMPRPMDRDGNPILKVPKLGR